jgi:hypothetical protein
LKYETDRRVYPTPATEGQRVGGKLRAKREQKESAMQQQVFEKVGMRLSKPDK